MTTPLVKTLTTLTLICWMGSVFGDADNAIAWPQMDFTAMDPVVATHMEEAVDELRSELQTGSMTFDRRGDLFGQLGQLLQSHDLFEAAVWSYRQASLAQLGEAKWHYLAAVSHLETGAVDSAMNQLLAVLNAKPDYLPAREHLARLLLQQGQADIAAHVIRSGGYQMGSSPGMDVLVAEIVAANGDVAAAIEILKPIVEANPKADRLNYLLGTWHKQNGDKKLAKELLRKAGSVGIAVNDPWLDETLAMQAGEVAMLIKGKKAFGAGDFESAVSAFEQAVERAPASDRARINLAAAYGEVGRLEEAQGHLDVVISRSPANTTALYNSAALAAFLQDSKTAIKRYEQLLALDETDSQAHLQLARLLRSENKLERAKQHIALAGRRPEFAAPAIAEMASTLVDEGQYAAARDQLETGLAIAPRDVRLNLMQAKLLAAAPDPSIRDGERALELARNVFDAQPSAEAAEMVAYAQMELGQCGAALNWLQVAANSGHEDNLPYFQSLADNFQTQPPCQ